MAQETVVMPLDRARGERLRADLSAAGFEFRSAPYAVFSAKSDGLVATFYTSGKLVVQGTEPAMFFERFLGAGSAAAPAVGSSGTRAATAQRAESKDAGPRASRSGAHTTESGTATPPSAAIVGSDECGKGDYFGPLVVCAVRLEPGDADKLRGSNVRDSKTLTDEQCLRLGAALRGQFAHAIARLDPPAYNTTYTRPGQLNDILANLHVQAITELARPGIHVLVDQFANATLLQKKLARLDIRLEQRTKAESNPAVAAASIIAREEFLNGIAELSREVGIDLHKGAGDPVDRCARKFVALHGFEALRKVAKMHFKNTQKIHG